MPSPSTAAPYDALFTSTASFQEKHRVEFRTEAGDRPLRLTVRQDVKSKAGLKILGRSIMVFDFEPAGAGTSNNSPTGASAHGREAPAYDDASTTSVAAAAVVAAAEGGAAAAGGGGGGTGGVDGESSAGVSDCVVFVHDRYNGSKQLYVNQALVYSVEKECTDGMMNSWVIPLSFGRVALRLTNKLLSKSGFQYTLTRGDGMELFKTKS